MDASEPRPGADRQLPLARSCGACTACCTVHGVVELDKPGNTACQHLGAHAGCGIYATRPGECVRYGCLWLDEAMGKADDRPDLLGLILDLPTRVTDHPHYRGIPTVCAREVWPEARHGLAGARVLRRLSDTFVVRLTHVGGRTQLTGPRTLVEELSRRAQEELP